MTTSPQSSLSVCGGVKTAYAGGHVGTGYFPGAGGLVGTCITCSSAANNRTAIACWTLSATRPTRQQPGALAGAGWTQVTVRAMSLVPVPGLIPATSMVPYYPPAPYSMTAPLGQPPAHQAPPVMRGEMLPAPAARELASAPAVLAPLPQPSVLAAPFNVVALQQIPGTPSPDARRKARVHGQVQAQNSAGTLRDGSALVRIRLFCNRDIFYSMFGQCLAQ